MTRHEFIENVNHWWELLEFCYNEDCEVCDDIVEDGDRDNEIYEDIREYMGDYSWSELRDMLDRIPTGYDYYRRDGAFDYCGMDDESDFDRYKDDVIEWMDDGGYWEDEEDEDDYADDAGFAYADAAEPEEPAEEPVPDEDFSVGDLMGMCCVAFVAIQQDNERREQESAAALQQYLNEMPKVLR